MASAAPRQDPATGLPVRGRPQPAAAGLAGPPDFVPAPVPVSGIRDQSRVVASDPRPARHADPAGLPALAGPGPGRAQPAARPRVDPDDDPLTSPSFPRIPADDSRSYRNGRADTPPRGSRAPAPYPAATQQFASYEPPAPDYHGNGSRDTDPTYPNGYRHDPLLSRDPYAAPAAQQPSPAQPSPAAPATAGNPYGSYVTPDSQATVSGYSEYSGAHSRPAGNGNANGSYLPPAPPGETTRAAGNGHWHQQPPTPGSGLPVPEAPSYLSGPRQYADPLGGGGHQAGYGNGYANGYASPDPAGYPPGSHPAGPEDPAAGYAPLDPYGRDGYGGYPGYGAPGR
jgi:DNA polymerase-3 subunit gamma/tau